MRRLYTIGYEGADIASFLATLSACGIAQIIDVRDVPISRKRGFSKNHLREALHAQRIDYLHLKHLGDPKPGREAARAGKISTFRSIYRKHLETESALAALEEAHQAALRKVSCLLCFERSNENCHRSIIADRLAIGGNFDTRHIAVGAFIGVRRRSGHDQAIAEFTLG